MVCELVVVNALWGWEFYWLCDLGGVALSAEVYAGSYYELRGDDALG